MIVFVVIEVRRKLLVRLCLRRAIWKIGKID